MIGIYKIISPSNKVYIGQSIDIEKRFQRYKKLNCKNQTRLYLSFLKYGVEKHKFQIIMLCEFDLLNELERYYQDLYSCIGKNGLNCTLTQTSEKKFEYCQDTKNKISLKLKASHKIKGNGNKVKKWSVTKKYILDLNTGIYYHGHRDYAKYSVFKARTTKRMLCGLIPNKTTCVLV